MRTLKISFLIFILSITISAQEGWFWQNPLPSGSWLYSVFQIEQNNAWAVGRDGTILRTDSSGNWISINANLTEDLYDVFFINENLGWIAAEDGKILNTSDGGESWHNQLGDSLYNWNISSVYFHDEFNGIALCGIYVFNTSNGGNTWTVQTFTNHTNRYCDRMFFLNDSIGWISGTNNFIYKTTDRGLNWVEIPTPNQSIGSIFFVDSLKGFAVGLYQLFKTVDGGMSWENINSTYMTRDLFFINQNVGWVVGWNGIIKTTDGGNSWINQTYASEIDYESVSFTDENNGLAVGRSEYMASRISKTVDGGANWIEQINFVTLDNLNDMAIIDSINILSVGEGDIIRTTNGGLNWFITREIQGIIRAVDFIDSLTGWCVGFNFLTDTNPFIYKTVNGGYNWELIPNSPLFYSELSTIKFLNNDTGFVGGPVGQLLKTTDGGQIWSVFSGTTGWDHFTDLYFVNDSIGWVVGWYDGPPPYHDVIYKTIDNGNSWQLQDFYNNNFFTSVFFINRNVGWVVGYQGIINTIDGGENWYTHPAITPTLFSVYFVNENVGWAVGAYGFILKTTNGGIDWWKQESGTVKNLLDVKFINDSIGFVIGADGIILKTYDGGGKLFPIPLGVNEPNIVNLPKIHYLYQNYPNPFNPVTKIKYSIPSVTLRQAQSDIKVTLKVYDILGREVATLVNEEKPAGEYEFEFNAARLPSGIYFYQLRAGEYRETKKMVLLK